MSISKPLDSIFVGYIADMSINADGEPLRVNVIALLEEANEYYYLVELEDKKQMYIASGYITWITLREKIAQSKPKLVKMSPAEKK